ncbi:MAG: AAA domain-containing protein [Sphaerochaetaceae bacterium]
MNLHENLIIANDRVITTDVKFCKFNLQTNKYEITFNSGKKYSYNHNSVTWLKNPKVLNPANYEIAHGKTPLFGIDAIYDFENDRYQCWHICFDNGNERDYGKNSLHITASCLAEPKANNVFTYLKQVADTCDLRAEDGTKLLPKQYEKIQFVEENKALSFYLDPEKYAVKKLTPVTPIFPFGCNESQYHSVRNALSKQISVIQGPPGTGKTQTILNIIANLLVAGKTVQVVSNNNSATANIMEKLSSCDLGFIVASLGNTANKRNFIQEQSGRYPDILQSWRSDVATKIDFFEDVCERSEKLKEVFTKQKLLAQLKQNLRELETEYKHFCQYSDKSGSNYSEIMLRRTLTIDTIFNLWKECERFSDVGRKVSFIFKLKCRLIYGIATWNFYRRGSDEIVTLMQSLFYRIKHIELNREIEELEKALENCNQKKLMEELTGMSMQFLKAKLYYRYRKKSEREIFSEDDLWKNYEEVQKEYPVVLSTTFSSRCSLGTKAEYDYIIIDEASQVDVATGALALSCAKNAVIVGDTKQLPNVVDDDRKKRLQALYDSYHISNNYNSGEKNFLQSVCSLLPDVPTTLLREHYRCHPKIINFCNKKFYNGQLLIMTKDDGEEKAISVMKTVAGNHKRDHMNQRQIDVIVKEIIPSLTYSDDEIGIISPYNEQVNALKIALEGKKIDVATVHKFQGREKNVIIISTVDDEMTQFADNPNLLNVAVSRAKKRLYLVVSGNEQPKNSNVRDLIDYIAYNNGSIEESNIYSVFDLLYHQYEENRLQYLKTHNHISTYDSENFMYGLIQEVLHENSLPALDVVCHEPLNMVIRDTGLIINNLMTESECRYAMNGATHLDFLIYNLISKKPVLAIEVDGFRYHKKGTVQSERDKKKNNILELYGIPLLRFPTNGSGEKNKLIAKLKEVTSC